MYFSLDWFLIVGKLVDSFLQKEESVLFHSMLMVSNSWWVVEKCFPVSLCLMWDQIFSIGFKSGLWPGQNMSLMDLFSSHVLVVFAVWAGALSCWKITSDCSALENNFSIVGSKPFCNIILYSKALIDFSQWSSSPVPAAEKAPHTMTPLPPCLTVVEMHSLLYFSPDLRTHISGGQHVTEILIHHSTQLCWTTPNQTFHILNFILSDVFSETAMAF